MFWLFCIPCLILINPFVSHCYVDFYLIFGVLDWCLLKYMMVWRVRCVLNVGRHKTKQLLKKNCRTVLVCRGNLSFVSRVNFATVPRPGGPVSPTVQCTWQFTNLILITTSKDFYLLFWTPVRHFKSQWGVIISCIEHSRLRLCARMGKKFIWKLAYVKFEWQGV